MFEVPNPEKQLVKVHFYRLPDSPPACRKNYAFRIVAAHAKERYRRSSQARRSLGAATHHVSELQAKCSRTTARAECRVPKIQRTSPSQGYRCLKTVVFRSLAQLPLTVHLVLVQNSSLERPRTFLQKDPE